MTLEFPQTEATDIREHMLTVILRHKLGCSRPDEYVYRHKVVYPIG